MRGRHHVPSRSVCISVQRVFVYDKHYESRRQRMLSFRPQRVFGLRIEVVRQALGLVEDTVGPKSMR